ncbi:synaptophysin-like [Mytilus californianus]|uniref:synaptophysin-like n=1 Tax=Mytilus californianus TaxID=6549 RepID=UPI002244FD55|nr:synaptophysin-like [Mytilus californianus]
MESAKNAMSFSIEPLKEPRGFIKVLQWILSIFAFATTVSLDERIGFHAVCNNGTHNTTTATERIQVAYPYDLHNEYFMWPLCTRSSGGPGQMALLEGAKSSAEFYVFVGVFVFLYCLAALVLYLLFDELYRSNTNIVTADFIISVVVTLFWLIGSSAWAQGLVNLKYYTDFDKCGQFDEIGADCKAPNQCVQTIFPNFASLNVSVIFGFLNMLVWAGNLWFLYKETPWFKVRSKPPQEPSTDPQRI